MSTKAKFRAGQFATVQRYVEPVFPAGTMVEIIWVAGNERTGFRYQCKEYFYGNKTGWVDEEDLE